MHLAMVCTWIRNAVLPTLTVHPNKVPDPPGSKHWCRQWRVGYRQERSGHADA